MSALTTSVLTTNDGWPISRLFFARCGIPLLDPCNFRIPIGLLTFALFHIQSRVLAQIWGSGKCNSG
jgi:hypothetical protein